MTTRIILVVICTVLAVVSAICIVRACIDTYRIKKIYRFELQRRVDELNTKISKPQQRYARERFVAPIYWVFTTHEEIALMLSNGDCLSSEKAAKQYPDYFNQDGKPLIDRLPFKRGEVYITNEEEETK